MQPIATSREQPFLLAERLRLFHLVSKWSFPHPHLGTYHCEKCKFKPNKKEINQSCDYKAILSQQVKMHKKLKHDSIVVTIVTIKQDKANKSEGTNNKSMMN